MGSDREKSGGVAASSLLCSWKPDGRIQRGLSTEMIVTERLSFLKENCGFSVP